MADGKIVIETGLSTEGIEKGIGKISSLAKTGLKTATAAIAGVSTALLGAGGFAVKAGSDFEESMSQVAATMGMTTEEIAGGSKAFETLENAAKDAGATTKFSATEAGQALNYLALAGYDAQTAADALPAVLNLAAAGGLDLAYASDLATDAMSALGIEASQENLTKFGDEMAKTASKANTSVGQLGEAILTVGGTAKGLAGGTNELNATLGVLANRGIKGSEGGTALRNVILSLTAPTDVAAKKIKELGLEVYDAEGNMRPLNETFKDLDSKLGNMTEGQKTQVLNEIFNKVDLKSVQALLAGCGDEFDNLSTEIANSSGAMQNMADVQIDNLKGQMTILGSSLEGLGIQIYEELEESLKEAASEGTDAVGRLSDALKSGGLEGAVEEAGSIIADLAVKIADSAPNMIKSATKLIKSFVKGIVKNKKELKTAAKEIVAELVDGLTSLLPKQLQEPVKKATEAMAKSFNDGGLRKSITTITTLFTNVGKVALNLTNAVLPPLTDAIDFLGDNLDIIIPLLGGVTAGIIAFKAVNTTIAVVQGLTTAMGALNAAMAANPVGLVIAGIAGLVSIMGISTLATKDEQTETRILNEELHNQAEAVRETQKARQESVTDIESEYSYYQRLWDELQKNVDENGKIREGYEKRAAFITSTLSEALGIEIELNGNVITSYGELRNSIDQVIERKKANAVISAYESDYQEAIKGQARAQEEVSSALKDLNEAKQDAKTADRELAAVMDDNNLTAERWTAAMEAAEEKQAKANERLKEAEIVYKDAKTVASEYNTTITNYEEAVGAVESGSEDVAIAIAKLSGNMKTASSAQAGELSKQVQKYRDSYENMKTAVADGGSGVTQEAVNQAQAMYYLSEAEYAKSINMPQEYIDLMMESAKCAFEGAELPEAAKNAMGEALGAAQQSLNDNGQTVISASQQIVDSTTQTWTNGNFKGIFSDEINSGINGANAKLLEGAETLGISTKKAGDTVNNSMKSVPLERDWYEKGEKATLSEAKGISEASGKVLGSVQHLTDDTKATFKNADLPSAGRKEGEGLSSGMGSGTSSNAYKAIGAAEGMTNDVKDAASDADLYGNAYRDGSQFSAGLAAGIYGGASGVVTAAVSVVGQAIEAAERKAQINSPSKKMEYVGKMYDAGMERGIDRNQGAPVKAAEELSESMLRAFDARTAFSSMRSAMSASLGRISENIILKSAIPRSQKSEGENKDTTINQTVNINQPVKTPVEMSRELKRAGKELAFG